MFDWWLCTFDWRVVTVDCVYLIITIIINRRFKSTSEFDMYVNHFEEQLEHPSKLPSRPLMNIEINKKNGY